MTTSKIEITIECHAWGMTAPWDQRTADVIDQPSLEAAHRLARVLAADHGPRCVIAIRETGGDQSPRPVDELRGERVDCEQTEREFIVAMLARGQDRAEISSRIEWGRGHALIGDVAADALHRLNGES